VESGLGDSKANSKRLLSAGFIPNGVEIVLRNIQLTVFVAEAVKAFVVVIETLDAFRYYIGA
jgi:hypothetical protein